MSFGSILSEWVNGSGIILGDGLERFYLDIMG